MAITATAAVCICLCFSSFVSSKSLLRVELEHGLSRPEAGNIVQVVEGLGLHTLVKLVTEVQLVDFLESKGPFTVFGPTDKAFASLPPNVVALLKNETILKGVLTYHVLSGAVLSKDLKNDAMVDSLLPPYKIRINVYEKRGGTVYTAACQNITIPDQIATNGAVHVVSGVMLPYIGTLTDLINYEKQYFGTLAALLNKAGLEDTLRGPGPFTLFMPVNEAFDKLDPALKKKILNDPALLKKVLLYHVVPATGCLAGLDDGMELPTVEGSKLKVALGQGYVKVGNAYVVYPNSNVINGVGHVIESVLIPPSLLA